MDYQTAVAQIVSAQNRTFGGFYGNFPNINKILFGVNDTQEACLPPVSPEALRICVGLLLTRAMEMKQALDGESVRFDEFFRFYLEYQTVLLLLVIMYAGAHGIDIPLTENQIDTITSESSSLFIAGALEEEPDFILTQATDLLAHVKALLPPTEVRRLEAFTL